MRGIQRKWLRRAVILLICIVFYAVTVVPVGMFLYSLKSEAGWDVFQHGGYHTYLKCLAVSVDMADMPQSNTHAK